MEGSLLEVLVLCPHQVLGMMDHAPKPPTDYLLVKKIYFSFIIIFQHFEIGILIHLQAKFFYFTTCKVGPPPPSPPTSLPLSLCSGAPGDGQVHDAVPLHPDV